jgi:hypothetical protein
MLFLSVRGFSDYAGPTVHSRLAWLPCCLPLTRNEVGILIYGLFAAQSPRPPMPLSTLQETPRDVPSKTQGQDGFATSFPVGLLHPLVGSRTGAILRRCSLSVAPRFLWECLISRTVSSFPAPASSNPSCRFPAMGLPAHFLSRVMRPLQQERLSAAVLVDAAGNRYRVPASRRAKSYSTFASRILDVSGSASGASESSCRPSL